MQIGQNIQANVVYKDLKQSYKKDEALNAKQISNSYFLEYSKQIATKSSSEFNAQNLVLNNQSFPQDLAEILKGIDTKSIGYNGKALNELSKDEATELVGDNGFFGIAQTSQRISDFVLTGAKDDIDMLKAGREGILQGFKEAEKLWGGKLPEISQKTIEKAVEAIDKKIASLGEKVINVSV